MPFAQGGRFWADQTAPVAAKLGKTPFGAVSPTDPAKIRLDVGARRLWYSETYYFGNPGLYQWYVVSLNQAADFVGDIEPMVRWYHDPQRPGDPNAFPSTDLGRRFRSTTCPNTYSVSAPMFDPDTLAADDHSADALAVFGADYDTVRVFESG